MTRGIIENLIVMFLLVPAMALSFWWFLVLINKRSGTNVKAVLKTIYQDPVAAAIYRAAMVITVGIMVTAAFGRWV